MKLDEVPGLANPRPTVNAAGDAPSVEAASTQDPVAWTCQVGVESQQYSYRERICKALCMSVHAVLPDSLRLLHVRCMVGDTARRSQFTVADCVRFTWARTRVPDMSHILYPVVGVNHQEMCAKFLQLFRSIDNASVVDIPTDNAAAFERGLGTRRGQVVDASVQVQSFGHIVSNKHDVTAIFEWNTD